jgi:hypothetical protein
MHELKGFAGVVKSRRVSGTVDAVNVVASPQTIRRPGQTSITPALFAPNNGSPSGSPPWRFVTGSV